MQWPKVMRITNFLANMLIRNSCASHMMIINIIFSIIIIMEYIQSFDVSHFRIFSHFLQHMCCKLDVYARSFRYRILKKYSHTHTNANIIAHISFYAVYEWDIRAPTLHKIHIYACSCTYIHKPCAMFCYNMYMIRRCDVRCVLWIAFCVVN